MITSTLEDLYQMFMICDVDVTNVTSRLLDPLLMLQHRPGPSHRNFPIKLSDPSHRDTSPGDERKYFYAQTENNLLKQHVKYKQISFLHFHFSME